MTYREIQLEMFLEKGITMNAIPDIKEGEGLYESEEFIAVNMPDFDTWLTMTEEQRRKFK